MFGTHGFRIDNAKISAIVSGNHIAPIRALYAPDGRAQTAKLVTFRPRT